MANDYQQLHDFADELDGKTSRSSSYDELRDLARDIDEQTLEQMKGYSAPKNITEFSSTLEQKPQDTWSKLKDMIASAGVGYTEGVTADKTAELLSSIYPIKTNTKQIQSIINRQHEDNPVSYTVGNVAGMAMSPITGFGTLGKLALPMYSAVSGAEGDSLKEKVIGAGVGGALGALTGAVVDKGLPYLGEKIPNLTQYAGKAMQSLGDVATSIEEPIGAIANKMPFISKYLDSAGRSKTGTSLFSDSKKMRELRKIEEAAALSEMGSKTANAIKSTEREIAEKLNSDQSIGGKLTNKVADFMGGDSLNKTYGTLSEPEKAVVMASMANGFKQRGLSTDPIALKATFEDMAKNSGINLDETSIRDVVRTLNRRDPAWAVNSFKNVSNFFGPLLERTGNVTPEYYEAQMNIDKLHGLLKQNAINRMMQTEETIGKGWMPSKQVNQYAQDASRLYPDLGPMSSSETTNIASMRGTQQQAKNATSQFSEQTKQQSQQIKMTKPWLGDASDETIKKYTGKIITDQNSLQEAGAIASGRLRNIQSGQAVANLAAGAMQGSSMLSQHGFPSIGSFLGMVPQAASWAGKAGQFLESKGASMTPDNFASQFLTNPSVIGQMAKSPGITGEMGRYLERGFESMGADGVKSRLFTTMTNPALREQVLKMMGNKQDHKPEMTKNLNH